MPKRVSSHNERFVPGTSFVVWIPLRYPISAKPKVHGEIKEYFSEKRKSENRCLTCKRKIDKETFSDVMRKELLKEINIKTIDILREIPPYNKLFKKWTKEFWENFPFKSEEMVTPSKFSRSTWEKFKKKKGLKNEESK